MGYGIDVNAITGYLPQIDPSVIGSLGNMTASSTYGFKRRDVGQANVMGNEPSAMTVGGIQMGHHTLLNNPVFWLLVFILIIVGYIGFMFDFSVKRLGEVKVGAGSKSK